MLAASWLAASVSRRALLTYRAVTSMTISVPTLILATGVVGLAVITVMALLYARHRGTVGYGAWLRGLTVHALGLVVLGFDAQLPEGLAVSIGNPLAALAPVFYIQAMAQLLGRRAPLRTLVLMTAGVVLATWYLTLVQPSVSLRLTLLGVHFLVAQSLLIGMMIVGLRKEPGRAYRTLLGLVVAATLSTIVRTLWFAANSDALDADGASSVVLFMSNLVFFATSGLAFVGVLEDRSRRAFMDANDALARLSRTDDLTELANRRRFDEMLATEIARVVRYGRPLTLVLLDLDHFKAVNDTFGHAEGDRVLRRVAHVMQATSRANDLAARLGGEELAMLLPETDTATGQRIADRVRERVRAAALPSGRGEAVLTISAGVASLELPSELLEAVDAGRAIAESATLERALATRLFHDADAALYAAKRAGRDRSVAATPIRTLDPSLTQTMVQMAEIERRATGGS